MYHNLAEIETGLAALASTYPTTCRLISLPNLTAEGRTVRAVRLGADGDRLGIFLLGGLHAREWMPPEICLSLAADLLEAYHLGTGLELWPGQLLGRADQDHPRHLPPLRPADGEPGRLQLQQGERRDRRRRGLAPQPQPRPERRQSELHRRRPQPQLRFPVRLPDTPLARGRHFGDLDQPLQRPTGLPRAVAELRARDPERHLDARQPSEHPLALRPPQLLRADPLQLGPRREPDHRPVAELPERGFRRRPGRQGRRLRRIHRRRPSRDLPDARRRDPHRPSRR